MSDRVRDWTEEPWRDTWGEHEGDYRIAEITDFFDARRADEAVNAMKGWSAPEGAVGRLVEAARAYAFGGERGIDLADALREFSPIVEPS